MKGIMVIIGGLGDLPNDKLDGKTPLEAAFTPNLDFLATRGELGHLYSATPGDSPATEDAILSIFQNNPKALGRSALEAAGLGIKLNRGDLVFRVNFGTVGSPSGVGVIDRRAGRTLSSKESSILAKAINKISFPRPFEFILTEQYKALLVFRGDYSEARVSGNDQTYSRRNGLDIDTVEKCGALDRKVISRETADIVNDFLHEAVEILCNHSVNQKREKRGLLPANYLFLRSPSIQRTKLAKYPKWVSANYTSLERGFSRASGMSNFCFKYPKFRGVDSYKNLFAGLKKACRNAESVLSRNLKKADYFYVHLKETDVPGHDNKPFEKKAMIEYIDSTLIKYIAKIAPMNKIKVVVTGDHSTPCKMRGHSSDPVPVLLYNGRPPKEKRFFNEEEARRGELKRMVGYTFLKKLGFLK